MFSEIFKSYQRLVFSSFIESGNAQNNDLPKVWFFWTWEKEYWHGWSGIKKILEMVQSWDIQAIVALIVSNYPNWWVKQKADNFKIPFHYMAEKFPKRDKKNEKWDLEYSDEAKEKIWKIYQEIMKEYWLEYIFLSWWLRYVCWIPFNKVINIHPGPTQEWYGWEWMHGMNVHEKIWSDYQTWKINQTCVTMHYATDKFDDPRFTIAQVPVDLSWPFILGDFKQENWCTSAEEVFKRVNAVEHFIQWKVTQLIVSWAISWTWNEEDKVQVNMEEVAKYEFPIWTVFAKNIDLQGGISYENRLN
jgi:folate-dependent phosphoribosylglycinamide formyltransferase PurN